MARTAGVDGRKLIVDAAAQLFYAHGIDAVGVEQVAQAAGVTKRTLYYHFASKEALVHAWLQSADAPALALLRSAAANAKSPSTHPVGRVLDALEKWMKTPRFHGCAFINASRERPDDPTVRTLALGNKAVALRWFEAVATDERAPDPSLRARQYLMLVDGVLATGHLYPPEQLVATARTVLDALTGMPAVDVRAAIAPTASPDPTAATPTGPAPPTKETRR